MTRKGITPVIAVVLLLLITVGAVASAWGLYEQVVSDQSAIDDFQERQAAQQADVNIQSVYKDQDGTNNINVSLRNTGSTAVNLKDDYRLRIDPDGTSEYLPENLWDGSGLTIDKPQETCFLDSGTTLGANSEVECNTGVQFPSAGQTIGFRIQHKNYDTVRWDFSCSPASSSSTLC